MADQDDQDELELDYHLTFPTFQQPEFKKKDNEFVFIFEDNDRPVIVLLGWAGCQDKYLAKYSAIYEDKGYITLRYTAPVKCLFWRRNEIPNIGKRLLQVISDRSLDQHPIFFHVFSNGGAFLYQQISLAIEQSYKNTRVKGVIFDSSPGERRVTALFKAISAVLGGNLMTNIPMSLLITIFLSVLWLYEDVEKFAIRRAERGIHVQLVMFRDSPHVKHYATYPDVYVNTVCNFINDCLSFDKKSNNNNVTDKCKFQERILGLTRPIITKRGVGQLIYREVDREKLN
ncbi:transmembrane protein 53 isoform X2 [Aphidius gifuensis]|uniref:transmembrane protein 53 isoform X2 n=1 Tax=Aphidius gifuensis TaxID=684658 RepID=UPI001CDBE899|nr:transmembrane protein 53 isoform X2 [Aphidius gifuensis]